MTGWKLLTYLNWLLIAAWTGTVLHYFILPKLTADVTGRSLERAIRGVSALTVLFLIGLNLLPYRWTKVVTCLLAVLTLLAFAYLNVQ